MEITENRITEVIAVQRRDKAELSENPRKCRFLSEELEDWYSNKESDYFEKD